MKEPLRSERRDGSNEFAVELAIGRAFVIRRLERGAVRAGGEMPPLNFRGLRRQFYARQIKFR
jgi:hypothetical protein